MLKERKSRVLFEWNLNEQAAPCVLEKLKTSSAVLKSWKSASHYRNYNTSDGYLLISIFPFIIKCFYSHNLSTEQKTKTTTTIHIEKKEKFYFTFKTMLHHSRYVILCHGFSLDSKFNQNIFTATFNTKREFSVAIFQCFICCFSTVKNETQKK